MINSSTVLTIILAVVIIISGSVYSYITIEAAHKELALAQTSLQQSQAAVKKANETIDELTTKLTANKTQLQQSSADVTQTKDQLAALKTDLQRAQGQSGFYRDIAIKASNNQSFCSVPPAQRSCANYNIQILMAEKYICPMNYTVKDGYPPGGVKGPVCVMNSGADGTPATCKDFRDPGCDPSSTIIACYGTWPCSTYACYNYYNQWYVTKAMPAKEACGK